MVKQEDLVLQPLAIETRLWSATWLYSWASEMAADISGNDIFVQGDEIAVMSLPQKQASVFREGGFDPDSIGKAFGSSLKQAVRKPVSY